MLRRGSDFPSGDDVVGKREADVNRRVVDPAQLSGEALADWYGRTPDEIEQERNLREQEEYDAFFGGLRPGNSDSSPGSWEEADGSRPVARAPYRPPHNPQRDRARPAPPVEGIPQPPGAPGSFFGTHSIEYVNPTVPAPLNHVEPSGLKPSYYVLGDGTIESAHEIERVYAEQKRLLQGNDENVPTAHVNSADRFKDGYIPRADQLAKDDRELDSTCHPYGGWELDPQYPGYSKRTKKYEEQITRAPGLDYVVRIPGQGVVKFDGCAVWDPRRQLLEAKGRGREGIIDFLRRLGRYPKMLEKDAEQVGRQVGAAQGRRVDWHAAERGYRDALDEAIYRKEIPRPSTFRLYHTPAR